MLRKWFPLSLGSLLWHADCEKKKTFFPEIIHFYNLLFYLFVPVKQTIIQSVCLCMYLGNVWNVWNVKTLWIMAVCLFIEYHLPISFFDCLCYVEWFLDGIWNVVSGWGLILRLISKCLCMIPLCPRISFPHSPHP